MSALTFKEVSVQSRTDGQTVKASLAFCPECGNEGWLVFTVAGQNHFHLQCSDCAETFCSMAGGCNGN